MSLPDLGALPFEEAAKRVRELGASLRWTHSGGAWAVAVLRGDELLALSASTRLDHAVRDALEQLGDERPAGVLEAGEGRPRTPEEQREWATRREHGEDVGEVSGPVR